jgi:hypothetical protein
MPVVPKSGTGKHHQRYPGRSIFSLTVYCPMVLTAGSGQKLGTGEAMVRGSHIKIGEFVGLALRNRETINTSTTQQGSRGVGLPPQPSSRKGKNMTRSAPARHASSRARVAEVALIVGVALAGIFISGCGSAPAPPPPSPPAPGQSGFLTPGAPPGGMNSGATTLKPGDAPGGLGSAPGTPTGR